jgi:glyoxylase-like metal-dependent hydrolase (beta-lactamase superfamily II)
MRTPNIWNRVIGTAIGNGFPAEEIVALMQKHPQRGYQHHGLLNWTLLQEGDILAAGGYEFQCVQTPGHTPGHLCLYDAQTIIFFSGDHILEDITSNISMFDDNGNPLQCYRQSLDKIDRFDIAWVFPGHRRIFTDCRGRIAELKRHHQARAEEIKSVLARGRRSAYETASLMTWDIHYDMWEDFPVPHKWFACGEVLSHLLYLLNRNEIKRES